ncbi:LysE family translocator [Pseudomonas sp. Fig-3]|uniref:LysE family translocator n=1 Tax=Pseudomonas TaxID=286 RepID=UPI0006406F21|nr:MULTISPECIES: LysE family translocator [Pseudomonas]MDD2034037.1 LysE family translocator [Pseudomonas sp. 39167]MDR8386215.1 LysE family translocator [Pseudomonas sp. JL2]TNB81942.1 LysE family translocator [Pseudomonas sp. Fig-3]WNZ80632.1 LysE family translocator [Pseudomonas sp. P105]VII92106.1 hypothetical protein [Pseudomonas sp. FG-3G]
MSAMSSIWLFIIPFAIAAAIPGPAQGALIGQVVSRGGRSCLPFVAGMVGGNALWLLLATTGLSALALRYEHVFIAVKWAGVAYLLFIAWKLWSASGHAIEAPAERSASRGLLAGALLTLSNPKAVIFFGAVLPHAFDLASLTLGQALMITALGIAIDLIIQLGYVFTGIRIKGAIQSPSAMRRLNRTSAGLITGCASWMAVSR